MNGKVISLQFITKYQYLYSDDCFIIKSQSDLIECGFINNEVVNAYIFVPINVKINSFFTKWNKHAHII